MAGVVEPQKTWEIQKNAEREVKEILVEVGSEVEVGTALFIYDTESLEADLQQAQLGFGTGGYGHGKPSQSDRTIGKRKEIRF